MLDEFYKYSKAFNKKGGLLPTEPMIMASLIQYKMIRNLLRIIESRKINEKSNYLKSCNDGE